MHAHGHGPGHGHDHDHLAELLALRAAVARAPHDGAIARRDRAIRRVLYVTLGLNLAIAMAKIAYGYSAAVLSIRADGFHSLTDGLNNVIALIGVWLASRPPDEDHPYGHAKFEVFAAMAIGLGLLLMAGEVVRAAIDRLRGLTAAPTDIGVAAFAVLGGTLVANLLIAIYEARAARRLGSPVLESDAKHTLSDVYVTISVLFAVVVVRAGYPVLDTAAALLVAAMVAWTGVGILWKNGRFLADAAVIDADGLRRTATAVPGVASAHKVRTRGTPDAVFVDLHIQVSAGASLAEAHQLTHQVIDAIKECHPQVRDVTIHTEPDEPVHRDGFGGHGHEGDGHEGDDDHPAGRQAPDQAPG